MQNFKSFVQRIAKGNFNERNVQIKYFLKFQINIFFGNIGKAFPGSNPGGIFEDAWNASCTYVCIHKRIPDKSKGDLWNKVFLGKFLRNVQWYILKKIDVKVPDTEPRRISNRNFPHFEPIFWNKWPAPAICCCSYTLAFHVDHLKFSGGEWLFVKDSLINKL